MTSLRLSARALVCIAALAIAAPLAGCGGDKPADAKTPGKGVTGSNTPAVKPTGTPTPALPPTPANVLKSDDTSALRIDDRIKSACGITDQEAYFAFDSSTLRDADISVLDKVATCFLTGPLAGKGMRLVGHADKIGAAEYNRVLGLKRADSVKDYLTGRGLAKTKVDSTSLGSDGATGEDDAGRAKDRRVDVLLSE